MIDVKKILILLCGFLFTCEIGLSQNSVYTAHKLIKLFKSSIDQESKKAVSIGAGAWIICNHDSSYFRTDTIRLFNNINYFYQNSSCCDFVDWTFYKRNAFAQSKFQICNEPSTRNTSVDFYKIKIFSDKQIVYLLISKWKSVEMFQLIGVDDIKLLNNQSTKVITIKRVFGNHQPIIGHTY